MLVIAAIAATAMRAAIRPYSIAVAPLSLLISFRNLIIPSLLSVPNEGSTVPPADANQRQARRSTEARPALLLKRLRRRVNIFATWQLRRAVAGICHKEKRRHLSVPPPVFCDLAN